MEELKKVLTETVLQTEDEFIFVEPVCNFFGISYRNQFRKIKEDPICQTGSTKKYNEALFGDRKNRFCINKRAFLRWIQIINAQIVHENLRELFLQYQVAVFDFLYKGAETRKTQLEDIRSYAININNAMLIKNHILEYIGEQKRHRDLCLATSPDEWVSIRERLTQTKAIPSEAAKLKAINALPSDMEDLKRLKKNLQTDIIKNKNRLKYQSPNIQAEENPIPDGYRREKLKLLIKNKHKQIEQINERMLELKETEG